MALRFFADPCVPTFIVERLRDAGHEVLRLKDRLPVESSDSIVLSRAQEIGAILLSLNGDFADIVSYPPAQFKGIISLQVKNHPEVTAALVKRLVSFLETYSPMEYFKGKLIAVEPDRIRRRG